MKMNILFSYLKKVILKLKVKSDILVLTIESIDNPFSIKQFN